MVYRAAIDNNGLVICIGRDENQSGDYNGMGTWCDFTFTEMPAIPAEVLALMQGARPLTLPLLKVEAGSIMARSLAEVEADLG